MFDLDQSIAEWRRQSEAGGITFPEVLDELECHLRDEIEQQVRSGAETEHAFAAAIQKLGQIQVLQPEFEKAARRKSKSKPTVMGFASVTSLNRINYMTTPDAIHMEPTWATYLKAGGFLLPALSLWAFATVFLFPKVQQICRDAGIAVPGFFRAVMALMGLFREHGLMIFCLTALVLGVFEWRSVKWPRYRRASIGLGVFLLNSAVLLVITSMFTLALMAAPALFRAR